MAYMYICMYAYVRMYSCPNNYFCLRFFYSPWSWKIFKQSTFACV